MLFSISCRNENVCFVTFRRIPPWRVSIFSVTCSSCLASGKVSLPSLASLFSSPRARRIRAIYPSLARYSRLELTLYNTFVIRIDECVTVPRSLTSRREMADDRGSLELFPFLSRAPRFFEWPSRADQHDAKSSVRAFPHRQTVLHCPRRYVPPSSLPLPHPLLISSYSSFSSTRIIRYLFIWERFNLI